MKSSLRTRKQGHSYYKSSDCPTCPICEAYKKPREGVLSLLAAPARRALESAHILSLETLSTYSEKDILKLHGMGKSSISILKKALHEAGLSFLNS